jgi:hypothetical protein
MFLILAGLALAVGMAAPWSAMPLAKWTEVTSKEGSDTPATPGTWTEETDGALTVSAAGDRWATRLAPMATADAEVAVRFTVQKSSGAAFTLPGGCVRWGYYWGENNPGWDVGVVLRGQDPLNFYRVALSATRGELALWDTTGGYLQLVPCPVKVGQAATLTVKAVGAHITAALDGAPVLDYWDRTNPYLKGRVGLAVFRSTVRVESFAVTPVKAEQAPMPAHKPDFRFEQRNGTMALFDGREPICHYWVTGANYGAGAGVLYMESVKLKPGWRPTYYTSLGPNVVNAWMQLKGKLPEAFTVDGGGDTISFRFATETAYAHCDYTCTVRYDAPNGVYRYEYAAKFVATGAKPIENIGEFEWFDPLTYNNRVPGGSVEHTWNAAGHRWNVFQGPKGAWQRYAITDYNSDGNNVETTWPAFRDFLYPDPSGACPAFETAVGWEQTKGRFLKIGQCNWGYDYHHAEVGPGLNLAPGSERPITFTFTALPNTEADKLFAQSVLCPGLEKVKEQKLYPINLAGTSFNNATTTLNPPQMLWTGKVDETVGHTDKASARIDGPGTAGIFLYQYAVEQYTKRWLVRGWMKTKDSRGRGLQLRVKYAYAKEPEQIFYLGGRGTQDWTPFAFVTTVLTARDCTNLAFEQDGPGTVWIDDLSITALKEGETPKVTEVPVPAGLEPSTECVIDLRMSEAPGSAVYDESRNGHSLNLQGNPEWRQENGRGFLHFDGVDDCGNIVLKPVLEPRDAPEGTTGSEIYKPIFRLDRFSYEYWVRPQKPATNGWGQIMDFRFNPQVYVDPNSGKAGECKLIYQNDVWRGEKIRFEAPLPYDKWTHIVAAHGDGKVAFYVNGEPAGEKTYDPKTPGFAFFAYAWKLNFGSFLCGVGGRFFTGDLGPIRLYTKALTADEVKKRFTEGWPETK